MTNSVVQSSRCGAVRGRAVVLLMTLVVITIGALIATTVLYAARAQSRAAQVSLRASPARAMAWSGVQAVMAELASQREDLLQGGTPRVTEYWLAGGEADAEGSEAGQEPWGFRVLRVKRGAAEEGTTWIACEPEMGKIDINTAPAAVLARLPGVSERVAGAIVAAREAGRFSSVYELLRVPGVTEQMVYEGGGGEEPQGAEAEAEAGTEEEMVSDESDRPDGNVDDVDIGGRIDRPIGSTDLAGNDGAGSESVMEGGTVPPLEQLVTVFSFDPEVQLGFGGKASEVRGNQRINLNVEWTEELGSAIERRFDRGVADGVKLLLQRGRTFKKTSDIVRALREFQVKPDGWIEVLDAFTTSDEEYRFGLVDLGTASEAALASVPGIRAAAAKEIIFRRTRLDEERRRTVVWPVLEGILSEDEFEQAVDHLTTRCLQWRVVIEGGLLPDREETLFDGEGGGGRWYGWGTAEEGTSAAEFTRRVDGRDEARTGNRVVLEAVIDVSSMRPRVAMLRDVTHMPLARKLGRDIAKRAGSAAERERVEEEGTRRAAAAAGEPEGAAVAATEDDGMQRPSLEIDGLEPLVGSEARREDRAAARDRNGNDSGESAAGAGSARKPDRRVGRWTTGGEGGKP